MQNAFNDLGRCAPVLAALALLTGSLWVGTLFAVSWLSGRARYMADGVEIATLALGLNRSWATPCLLATMVFALGWACLVPPSTFDAYTMLAASVAMFVLVLVHASAANRAVRIAGGSRRAGRGEPLRRIALVLSVAMLAGLVGARGAVMH
jgi:hypothetical protein